MSCYFVKDNPIEFQNVKVCMISPRGLMRPVYSCVPFSHLFAQLSIVLLYASLEKEFLCFDFKNCPGPSFLLVL